VNSVLDVDVEFHLGRRRRQLAAQGSPGAAASACFRPECGECAR
jgi:hypothetical protein